MCTPQDLPLMDVAALFREVPYAKRLRDRLVQTVAALAAAPAASFPTALGAAGYTGLVRMLHNPRVVEAPPLAPVLAETCRRAAGPAPVLAVHDTTEMRFGGARRRAGLGRLSKHDQGFLAHTTLAVRGDGTRTPLGVLALEPLVRAEASRAEQTDRQRYYDPTKESRRWARGVAAAEAQLAGRAPLIHVFDREAEEYELLVELVTHDRRFVARMHHDRLLAEVPADLPPTARTISDTFAHGLAALCTREVPLSPRGTRRQPHTKERHPSRLARLAQLEVTARAVTIKRPKNAAATLPAALSLHVVRVRELAPPAGEDPVEWWLLTTEPIATAADVLQIVDWYRARWVIEEFFKALKTGCAYEARQLDSFDALWIVLILCLPIATNLLRLRTLAAQAPATPATEVLAPQEIEVLRATGRVALPAAPTVTEALYAVAALGGHLRHNGAPGWLILARGLVILRERVLAWRAAKAQPVPAPSKKSDQS